MGFYGVDQEAVIHEIDKFVQDMNDIAGIFEREGRRLFEELRNYWYSPAAAAFSQRFSRELYRRSVDNIKNVAAYFAMSAKLASDDMLIANGGTPVSKDYSYRSVDGDLGNLLSSKDGVVGMDVIKVEQIIHSYETNARNAIDLLKRFNVHLSIFDAKYSLVAEFDKALTRITESIQGTIMDLLKVIQSYLDQENKKLSVAVKKASNAISIAEITPDKSLHN